MLIFQKNKTKTCLLIMIAHVNNQKKAIWNESSSEDFYATD